MTKAITILGYEKECTCEHCGRDLIHGIRTDLYSIIGADCFNRIIKADRKKFSGNGKPGATYTRTLAKIAERDSPDQRQRMGYGPWHFVFELAQ